MRLEHVAIWVGDLERMKQFYETWFGTVAGLKYTNAKKGFSSYFLSFDSGARLEIMQKPGPVPRPDGGEVKMLGYTHLAIVAPRRDRMGRPGRNCSRQPWHDACLRAITTFVTHKPEGPQCPQVAFLLDSPIACSIFG